MYISTARYGCEMIGDDASLRVVRRTPVYARIGRQTHRWLLHSDQWYDRDIL